LHKVEECIVALHHFCKWQTTTEGSTAPLIAVDVCCGKGLYSLLLSYMFGSKHWTAPPLEQIILFYKDTKVSWHHIDVANENCHEEG
jgi:hypothetical protein